MRKTKKGLDLTESSNFHYLLELMPPMYREPAFAWLPELFSIIGYEDLILLCKFAGGEKIRIPTLDELADSVEALEWYYKVFITHEKKIHQVPARLNKLVRIIAEVFDARNGESSNQ